MKYKFIIIPYNIFNNDLLMYIGIIRESLFHNIFVYICPYKFLDLIAGFDIKLFEEPLKIINTINYKDMLILNLLIFIVLILIILILIQKFFFNKKMNNKKNKINNKKNKE